jgi:hypothetical protein
MVPQVVNIEAGVITGPFNSGIVLVAVLMVFQQKTLFQIMDIDQVKNRSKEVFLELFLRQF